MFLNHLARNIEFQHNVDDTWYSYENNIKEVQTYERYNENVAYILF